MIFIDRNLVTAPKKLTDENGAGKKELAKAIAHYTSDKKDETYKGFSVYGDEDVKEALITLFKDKCAYCESSFSSTYVGDIEHFRPKGGVEMKYKKCQHCSEEYLAFKDGVENKSCTHCGEAPSGTAKQLAKLLKNRVMKPGYYWLAADWDNLLYSCRNCNQKSKQFLPNAVERVSIGKMNQFPLLKEEFRVKSHTDSLETEETVRLLINPCIEDPEEYFEYDIKSGVMRAKQTTDFIKKRALSSINVYSLQRVPLVQKREKRAIEITIQMSRVEEAYLNVNDFYDPANERTERFVTTLRNELEFLKGFLKEEEDFLGLARQMIGTFMQNFQMNDINAA